MIYDYVNMYINVLGNTLWRKAHTQHIINQSILNACKMTRNDPARVRALNGADGTRWSRGDLRLNEFFCSGFFLRNCFVLLTNRT